MDDDNKMNEKQYGLLLAIKEALEAQPEAAHLSRPCLQ